MRTKTMITVAVLVTAAAIWAQDAKDNSSELQQTKNVAAPAQEPALGVTVSSPVQSEPSALEITTVSAPVQEPAPAVVLKEEAQAVAESKPAVEDAVEAIVVTPEKSGQGNITAGLITLNIKGADLNSVIRLFTELSGANIISPELDAVTGASKIDVTIKDVEWKPALQAILDGKDLELYEKIPGAAVYSIRKKLADAPPVMNVKSFKLNYAKVSDVSEMIKGLIPEKGKISVFPARNTIVVQSTPENLQEIQAMIAAVDLPRQQVFIEAKFMELSDKASEKLGIDWQVLGGYNVGVSDIGGSYGAKKMYDMDGDQYQDATYEWVENPNAFIPNPNDDPATPGDEFLPASDLLTTIKTPTVETTLGATLSADDFNLVLAALRETGGTKVVSNPKIIVANEETATIHIGTKKPNVRGTTQTAGDSQSTTTYALDEKEPYFTDGIKVEVTPTINTASNITVKIQPTLDRLDVIPFKAPDGTVFYGKSTKTINTLFSLENGQTAAIGGLTQTSADEVERKVPILGSIPFLGRFFSYSAKVNGQAETIIFVTVGLANADSVNMETGLPENSSLAMRYDAKARADRQIKAEERRIADQMEKERSAAAVQKLQAAEQKRLEKTAK